MDTFITKMLNFIPIAGLVLMYKDYKQADYDADRKYYKLVFPIDVPVENVHKFIRAIGSNLHGGRPIKGVPSAVFETIGSGQAAKSHRIRVPARSAEYIMGQLEELFPGIDYEELTDIHEPGFQFGVTIHMHNPAEKLPIKDYVDFSRRLLNTMQHAANPKDVVMIQWDITHSNDQKIPPSDQPVKSARGGVMRALLGVNQQAGHDEMYSRREKQKDQNYVVIGRVVARSETVQEAEKLVTHVVQSLASEGGSSYLWAKYAKPEQITEDVRLGRTPLHMTAQVDVEELAAIISWPPPGGVHIPGLPRGTVRHLAATEDIPQTGRVLGKWSKPASKRPIAMSYKAALRHTFIAGGTGVGKTTLLLNMARQDIEAGAGLILIERDGNLFNQILDQIPPSRMKDVICVDLSHSERPAGLNLLKTNEPEVVAGHMATLLEELFPDSQNSMYAEQFVLMGIPVLCNLERATPLDLMMFVDPQNPAEKAWGLNAIAKMPDRKYRVWWEEHYKNLGSKEHAQRVQPLRNRITKLIASTPVYNFLNQEQSSFNPDDVINGNKVLLVNTAGPSERAAQFVSNQIVAAIWGAAKRGKPTNPNFIYLDEAHQFTPLADVFKEMHAMARKYKLGLVEATQYIEQLAKPLQLAVLNNAHTKIIFQSSAESAQVYARDFATSHVNKESFVNQNAFHAIARILTDTAISEPVTLRTYAEPTGYNRGRDILEMSARVYGKSVEQIKRDDETRRVVKSEPVQTIRKDIGRSAYVASSE